MNDNWWAMQKMIEAREREIRTRIEQVKPWLSRRDGATGNKGGLRQIIGRALLSWGSAPPANRGRGAPASEAHGVVDVPRYTRLT